MPRRHVVGVEVLIHLFLTSVLDTEIGTPDRQALVAVPLQTTPHRLTALRHTKRQISAEYCFRHGMTIRGLLAMWKLTGTSKGRAYPILQPQRATRSSHMLSQSLQRNSAVQNATFLKITQFTQFTSLAISVRNKILQNPSGNKTICQAQNKFQFWNNLAPNISK